jgi:GNAT superfamily N-acetyltransferase
MKQPEGAFDIRAIETASAEYLRARVAALLTLKGNPYRAAIREHGPLQGFLVRATPSPMVNRICGDPTEAPGAFSKLVEWFAAHECSPAVPWIVGNRRPIATVTIGDHALRRLNGWTQLLLASPIDISRPLSIGADVEEVTPETIDAFGAIHAEAFHTPPAGRPVNRASFAGILAGDSAKGFIIRIAGEPVAGAIVYFADNGVACLGTAATRRDARGRGFHGALIAARIAAAREHGSQYVAATALANSQSRRNLERFGLTVSHTQTLYRVTPR